MNKTRQIDSTTFFKVRNLDIATDIPALVRLRQEMGHETTEAAQIDELSAPNQTPDQDFWVAVTLEQPKQFLGYGFGFNPISERYLAWLEVHPDWQRNGIGSALLAGIIERSRQIGTEHILINPDSKHYAAHALLQEYDFQPVSKSWFMSASATLSVAEPVWPSGYTVQSFANLQDYQILQEAYFRSCADLYGHGANSKQNAREKRPIYADWVDWFPESDSTGAGIFFAFAPDGSIAGLCHGFLGAPTLGSEPPTGLIDALGVVPKYRPYQLQRPLTQAVMRWLRARGQGQLSLEALGVDEETVQLYHHIGFTVDACSIAYQLDI